MDILSKMKDLQRKIDIVTTCLPATAANLHRPYSNYTNNLDFPIGQGPSSLSFNNLEENLKLNEFQNYNKKANEHLNNPDLLYPKRVSELKCNSRERRDSESNSWLNLNKTEKPEKTEKHDLVPLTNRISKIETNIESLEKKIDMLINFSMKNNSN